MTTTIEQPDAVEGEAGEDRKRSAVLPIVAGVVLIVVGLVAAGYGLYQSVITNLIAERAQEQLAADLDVRLSQQKTTIDRSEYLDVLEAQRTVIEDDPGFTVDASDFDDPDDVPIMVNRGDPTGLDPLVPDIDLPWVFETPPEQGEPLGRIVIPQADVDWVVVQGVSVEDLRKGPGHMPNTAVPGQLGNAVISGHRTTYGAPFFNIDRLERGDRFTVETVIGTHTYEVVTTMIVEPTDVWVTGQWEGAWLTLTTCNPRYSARERLIVFSKLVAGPNAESASAQFDGTYIVPVPSDD